MAGSFASTAWRFAVPLGGPTATAGCRTSSSATCRASSRPNATAAGAAYPGDNRSARLGQRVAQVGGGHRLDQQLGEAATGAEDVGRPLVPGDRHQPGLPEPDLRPQPPGDL